MPRAVRWGVIIAVLAWTGSVGRLEAQTRPGGEVVIRWPDPDSPRRTLQEVLDAAPDGAIVHLAAGAYQTGPLFVRDKALTIEGAGCDERPSDADPRRPATREDRPRGVTHLVGAAATEVVPAERATGVVNYVHAGGILRGVKLSGLDAGIVGRNADVGFVGPDLDVGGHHPGERPLFVRESCVIDSARGVLWLAPGLLHMDEILIKNVLWNGISIVGPGEGVHLADVGVAHAQNSCAFFVSTTAFVKDSPFSFCGLSFGIAAVGSSVLTVENSLVWFASGGPGIYLEESTGYLTHNTVAANTVAGILLVDAGMIGEDNDVSSTFSKNGSFGDGILAFLSGAILVNNDVHNNNRAGVSNFGSHVVAQANHLSCNGFDLSAEPVGATPHLFQNAGDNFCGCPDPAFPCVSQSIGLSPPEPLGSEP